MNENPSDEATPSPEEVADRAYYLYLEAGCPQGQDIEHWLTAEAELKHRPKKTASEEAIVACIRGEP